MVDTANKRAVEMDEDCLYLNVFSPNVSIDFIDRVSCRDNFQYR